MLTRALEKLKKSNKAVLMSEKAEVMPSLFPPFLQRKRSVSKLGQHSRSPVKAHALIPQNLIQMCTNPLDTENCYPQIKMTVRNWPISWRKIPPLCTYLVPCYIKPH